MREVAREVYQWSQFSEEKQLDFNGHFIISGEQRVLIDPPPLSDDDLAFIRRQGPVTAIILTNRDHVREADRCRAIFQTRILAPEQDAPLMEIAVDGTFAHGDRLAGGLLAVHIPDGKSPGESALLLERNGGIVVLGDALIGKPPGALNLLPPEKFADPKKAKTGVKTLLGYAFDTVLVGDGASILVGGKEAVQQAVTKGN
jgi:hypothetical protein